MKKSHTISDDILWRFPTHPKSEESMSNQLAELVKIARRIGMIAAADWIMENNNKKSAAFRINK